jgi:hypothetical protein
MRLDGRKEEWHKTANRDDNWEPDRKMKKESQTSATRRTKNTRIGEFETGTAGRTVGVDH